MTTNLNENIRLERRKIKCITNGIRKNANLLDQLPPVPPSLRGVGGSRLRKGGYLMPKQAFCLVGEVIDSEYHII
jgi:hypothetical protein